MVMHISQEVGSHLYVNCDEFSLNTTQSVTPHSEMMQYQMSERLAYNSR